MIVYDSDDIVITDVAEMSETAERTADVDVTVLTDKVSFYLAQVFTSAEVGEDEERLLSGDKAVDSVQHTDTSVGRAVDRVIGGIFAGVGDNEQSALFALRDDTNVAVVVDEGPGIIGVDLNTFKTAFFQIVELFLDSVVIGMDAAEGDQTVGIILVKSLGKFCDTVELTFSGRDR